MRYTEAAKLLDFFCKFMGRLSWDINHLKTKNPRKTRGGTAVSWKLTILPVPSNAVNRVSLKIVKKSVLDHALSVIIVIISLSNFTFSAKLFKYECFQDIL